jgi:L-aminopeptidase/D-esterase-like protein
VLFDRPAPAVVDVRGGAPGTRETALLGEGDLVQTVDAILLTGGSAMGLAAADGVMSYLREAGRGVGTAGGPVPIVPTAVLFDLGVGTPVWPTAEAGRAACENATALKELARGQVGAGTGATTGKLLDGMPQRGGIGLGHCEVGPLGSVSALVAVNAAGFVVQDGSVDPRPDLIARLTAPPAERTSTTLAVVVIEAAVDRRTLARCAAAAHDGFAHMIRPVHTIFDGDVVFVASLESGEVAPRDVLAYSVATELAVERAIVDAITA